MYSSDESGSSGLRRTTSFSTGTRGSRLGNPRQARPSRRHKRFNFSTETLGTLPEYSPSRVSTRPRPLLLSGQTDDTASQVQAWANDVAVASPPPTYPGYEDDAPQEGEFVEDKDPVPLSPISASSPRAKRVRRTRSVGRTNDRLDQLLERSVMALEASNALLQSSLTTHSSLAAVLADSSFDRSMDVQIRYLARRMGAEGSQENGLDKVLEEVVGLISSSGLEDALQASSVENAAPIGDLRGGAPSSMGYDNDGLTRSLPAEDHMEQMRMQQLSSSPSSAKLRRNKTSAQSQQRRLRLSDGPRPRSPPPRPFTQAISVESPNRVGYERNEASETIVLPSTSGVRTAPQEIPLYDPLPSATTTISSGSNIYQTAPSQPATPVTPSAYTMLSHIQSRSSSISRAASPEAFIATFRNSPRISIKALPPDPESPVPTRGRGMGDVRPGLTANWKASDPPVSALRTQNTWPQRLRSQSTDSHNPYEDEETPQTPPTSSRIPSASMVDLRSTLETPPKLPKLTIKPPPADEVGFLPSTSYKVSHSLRKILAEAEKQNAPPISEVAKGKQRAEGERPDDVVPSSLGSRSSRSLGAGRNLGPLTLTLTAPSISQPAVIREDFSKHMSQHRPSASLGSLAPGIRDELGVGPSGNGTSSPRRSAMKGSSGRTTPLSSGQSSPRVVTFSPLPPKYESDGSVGRARAKSKTKAKEAKDAKEAEKGGWWTQWLLGSTTSSDGGRNPFTPVHSRAGSMMREEGRWHGGLESWQV